MTLYVLEDKMRYAIELDTEEAEDAEILMDGQFNMQVLMQYIVDLPEIHDALVDADNPHPNAHIELASMQNYVLIAIDFDQNCSISHILDVGNALAADVDSIDDPVYLTAIRMHIHILENKIQMIQSGEMDEIQERIENGDLDEYEDEDYDVEFEEYDNNDGEAMVDTNRKQKRCLFAMKDSSNALDNIMLLRDVLEHQKLLRKGAVLYKDAPKHTYYLDVSQIRDDEDAMMTGYAALEMGFSGVKPMSAYLKEHCTVFPIL